MNNSSPLMDDEMPVASPGNRIIVEARRNHGNPEKEDKNKKKKKKKKMVVSYKECMKNHAAAIGGNARDGCGEFMPCSGEDQEEESPLQSLTCSACGCHRNFHRKEIQFSGEIKPCNRHFPPSISLPSPSFLNDNHHIIMSNNQCCDVNLPASSLGNMDKHMVHSNGLVNNPESGDDEKNEIMVKRKRFRTKFTEEQKEKMVRFAEKAGWRMKNLDESVVQEFCEEVGIKRRVLKVWMHNNKHNYLAKKLESPARTT